MKDKMKEEFEMEFLAYPYKVKIEKEVTMKEFVEIVKKNLGTTKLVGRIRKTH